MTWVWISQSVVLLLETVVTTFSATVAAATKCFGDKFHIVWHFEKKSESDLAKVLLFNITQYFYFLWRSFAQRTKKQIFNLKQPVDKNVANARFQHPRRVVKRDYTQARQQRVIALDRLDRHRCQRHRQSDSQNAKQQPPEKSSISFRVGVVRRLNVVWATAQFADATVRVLNPFF